MPTGAAAELEAQLSRGNIQLVVDDKDFLGLDIDPFSVSDGKLIIESRPLTDGEIARVKEAAAKLPPNIANTSLQDVSYSSGMISSRSRGGSRSGLAVK